MAEHQRNPLTAREQRILADVARGCTDDEIVRHMSCSVGTVRTHLLAARSKLGARNRAHAVAIAYHHGIFRTLPEADLVPASRSVIPLRR